MTRIYFSYLKYTFLLLTILVTGCASAPSIEIHPVQSHSDDIDINNTREKAERLYASGRFVDAYNMYQTLILKSVQNKSPAIWLGFANSALAISAHDAKYKEDARAVYTRLSLSATTPKPLQAQAKSGLALLARTQTALLAAASETPNDPRLWNALGTLYDQKQNWFLALDSYLKALELSHKNEVSTAPVQNNIGMSLLMQGRTDEALIKFKQAHTAHPKFALYDNNYRLGLILSNSIEKAVANIDDSYAAQLYNDAGFIAANLKQTKRARALYKKAIRISPVYFEVAQQNLKAIDATK